MLFLQFFVHVPAVTLVPNAMRDIFIQKARVAFAELFEHFTLSLIDHFPECTIVKEWNIDSGATIDIDVEIKRWFDACETPLIKGCAKYAKAVTSILGRPALVSHAIAYRDIDAVAASSTYFTHWRTKVSKLHSKDVLVFWQYVDELTSSAYLYHRQDRLRVPTTTEISADIAKRKGKLLLPSSIMHSNANVEGAATTPPWNAKSSHSSSFEMRAAHSKQQQAQSPPSQGVDRGMCNVVTDAWRKLHSLRGVEWNDDESEDLATRLCQLASEVINGHTVSELVQHQDVASFHHICATYPSLNSSVPLTEEQWSLLTQTLAMSTIWSAIPTPMMRGIQDVAMELANDIYNGNSSLDTLDTMGVTQRVLGALSAQDIEDFKTKIPDIVPNLVPILRSKL